jgi:serine/threonine protein kinase/TPR repeat protein
MSDSFDHELRVFSSVRQLPAKRRAAFLDEACAGDAILRQRVEELLRASESAPAFMETPAGNRLDPRTRLLPASAPVPAEKPGDRIGRYELLEQIGEGGCGTVYKAKQEQPVRRDVALKILKLGMDTKSVIARFEAERQALALMNHPNIAKVLDAGTTDTGRPYFVMELVDGVKITDFCDERQLSTRERLELFIQVCHAVQHAHQKGIIHRDLKPSNILVTLTDGVPVPKVIDFGIAKATRGKLTDQTVFTALEQFLGTPAYMSPEQADARETDIDTRSDIYSLGVLLYELLTGRTPFDAKELLNSGLDEIRRTIREEEPAAPSTQLSTMAGADLRAVAGHRRTDAPQLLHLVRGDLDWIVMKALEKDRARRYATTNGLALDIRRHLDNEPVAARPPSNAYRFHKLVRRHRLVFAAASAVVVALALGVAISVWALVREHRARLEADQLRVGAQVNEQKAEAEAAKNREVARFLEDMLQGVGPSVSLGADTTLLKKILDNTSQRIGSDLGRQPEVEAELRQTLGEVYWEIGVLTNAEAMDRRALEIRKQIIGGNSPEVAESMGRLSHVLWREGKLAEAESLARAGIEMERKLFGDTNLAVARSLEDYAAILSSKGLGGQAVAALREALAAKEAVLGHDNLEVSDTMQDLGGLLLTIHAHATEGVAVRREALAIQGKILGTNNVLVIIASLRLQAFDLDLKGRFREEEAVLKKLVAARRQLYGGPHPDLAQSLNHLAEVLKSEGKLAESEPVRREALAMQQKLLGPENTEVATTLLNLGQLLIAENKLAEAEPIMREGFEIRRKLLGDGLSLTTGALSGLGALLEQERKTEEATNLYLSLANGNTAAAATAQYRLGMMYLRGDGVAKDTTAGSQWILKSAQLGHTDAQMEMGRLYFAGTGVPKDEARAVSWFDDAAATANLGTTKATVFAALADCYCAAGRGDDALATIKQVCDENPRAMDALETMAAWQLWFGKKADYETTRESIMRSVTQADIASVAQAAAKVYCLRPSSDAGLLAKALELARHGLKLRGDAPGGAWYLLCLGMVEYRSGQYDAAIQDLAAAERTAGKHQDVLPTARLYRAMCLFKQNQVAEARQLFSQAETQMTPLPADPQKPFIQGKTASHDVIIGWLAYKEAKSVLYEVDLKP